jgi:hypothetical protein
MNNKKTIILAVVLIALVGLAFAYQGPIKQWQENVSKQKNFLAAINTEKIDKIVVAKNGETTLEKGSDGWLVGDLPTDQAGTKFKAGKLAVQEVLDKLSNAATAQLELVSTNKAKKADFKTDSSGVTVKIYQAGKEIAKLVVGKVAGDYQSSYIASPDTDSTYLLKGVNLSYALDKTDWRERVIFVGEAAKFSKLRIQQGKVQFTADLSGEKWTAEDAKKTPLNKDKVGKIIALMANLTAADIPAQDFKTAGLEKNQLIVEASGSGVKNTLMVGNDNGKGMFYAKSGDSDIIYLISQADRDELNKNQAQLK